MKRVAGLMALLIAVLTVTPAPADFYVVGAGGRLGTAITTVPVAITSPGLYYLSNNLTSSGTSNNAITVDVDDVTIDLMGFCLTGPGKDIGNRQQRHPSGGDPHQRGDSQRLHQGLWIGRDSIGARLYQYPGGGCPGQRYRTLWDKFRRKRQSGHGLRGEELGNGYFCWNFLPGQG